MEIIIHKAAYAQAPEIIWEQGYGGNHDDRAWEVIQIDDGGYLNIGHTKSIDGDVVSNNGLQDVLAVRTDSEGNLLWSKTYGGSDYDYGYAGCKAIDGGYIIAATSESIDGDLISNNGLDDCWIIKIDDSGDIEWQKNYGGSYNDHPNAVITTNDNGYFIVGSSQSNDGDVIGHHGTTVFTDMWVLKIDMNGNLMWNMSYGSSDYDSAEDVIEDEDGNFIFVGKTAGYDGDINISQGDYDVVLLKINSEGEIIWTYNYGGSWSDYGRGIVETSDGGYIVSSETQSDDGMITGWHGASDCWIFKTDSNGNLLWQFAYGSTELEGCYDIIKYDENQYVISATADQADGDVSMIYGLYDYWIFAIDSIGELLWEKSFGGSGNDLPYSLLYTSDNNILVTGYSNSTDFDVTPTYLSYNFWTVKLSFCEDLYFADLDGDGFGDPSSDSLACNAPLGYISDSTDCDDTNEFIFPTALDICNAIDDNCNGLIDEDAIFTTWYIDSDADGFGNILFDSISCIDLIGYVFDNTDCNDTNILIYPGAIEICDYFDNDCNGIIDDNLTYIHSFEDADDDNYGNIEVDSLACEIPDGFVEDDSDCDDTNPFIYPGADEILNGLDDNCDQLIDEGLETNNFPASLIKIFPNPVGDELIIQYLNGEVIGFEIYDVMGELDYTGELNDFTTIVSVKYFSSGIYFLRLIEGQNDQWMFIKE